jgi:hypothetical protein
MFTPIHMMNAFSLLGPPALYSLQLTCITFTPIHTTGAARKEIKGWTRGTREMRARGAGGQER